MPGGLEIKEQQSFAAGMVRANDRRLIPPNGAFDLVNWMVSDEGGLYRRGGCTDKSNADFTAVAPANRGIRGIWTGLLEAGTRTLFWDGERFGGLAADDTTPFAYASTFAPPAVPVVSEVVGGVLWLIHPNAGPWQYAGSLKTDQTILSAAFNQGSKTVTRTAGGFLAAVDPGMIVWTGKRAYVVKTVVSDTEIKLSEDFAEANETISATFTPLYSTQVHGSGADLLEVGEKIDTIGTASRRVLVAIGRKVMFSEYDKPFKFPKNNFHQIPRGSKVIGIREAGGVALLFTTGGVWALSNLIAPLVDSTGNPQHRLDQLSGSLILWGPQGISEWERAVVAPCLDGVWLIPSPVTDARTPPQRVSDSIDSLYRGYVRAGHQPGGGEVYEGHYFLPILDSSQQVVDLLVCRLDRPQRGGLYPWTRMQGYGAEIAALNTRPGSAASPPQLLAAGKNAARTRVLGLHSFLAPAAAVKADSNGTAHSTTFESRDVALSRSEGLSTVRRLWVRYVMQVEAGDTPALAASGGSVDGALTVFDGAGGASDGSTPKRWLLQRRVRYFRYRLTSTGPAADLRLRNTQVFHREAGLLR